MNYQELAALWVNQRSIYQEWQIKLLRSPIALRDALETELAPPNASWKEHGTNIPHRYVQIVDFYELDNLERRLPSHEAIRPDGVLVFGIGVTFDHGIDTYPKEEIYIPLASRFTAHGPEFSFFNKDMDEPDKDWSKDIAAFSIKIIDRFKDYLSHDPHTGFGSKTRMGFL